jgi:hypothetical protein
MTPSEQIVSDTAASIAAADALGRRLTVRRPSALDRLRLFKALGPELAQNAPYLGLAQLAFCVTEIDGVPQPQPVNEAQIEHRVNLLGNAGLAAVGEALRPPAEIDPGN